MIFFCVEVRGSEGSFAISNAALRKEKKRERSVFEGSGVWSLEGSVSGELGIIGDSSCVSDSHGLMRSSDLGSDRANKPNENLRWGLQTHGSREGFDTVIPLHFRRLFVCTDGLLGS